MAGKAYATKGTETALKCGFEELYLKEIVSFTIPANLRSRKVMEKIGMAHDPTGDFDHHELPKGHQRS